MKNKWAIVGCMALLGTVMFTSCEKAIMDEEETPKQEKKTNGKVELTLQVTDFRMVPYEEARQTRSVVDITSYSTRFNFVIYKDGKKVDSKSQMNTDADFGKVSMTLEPGTYKVLVLAHSSTGGNPTLSDPENIQFTNALGYSDTFYYYDNIEVTNESKTHNITLTRASSKLDFIITDEIPSNAKYILFKYTGGSGVLNALTGYGGNVNSIQQLLYNISGLTSPVHLPIYTFLKEDTGKLSITVTAQDADKNTIVERQFDNVPMKRNMMTEYSGVFFNHDSSNSFSFKAETGWEVYERNTFSF